MPSSAPSCKTATNATDRSAVPLLSMQRYGASAYQRELLSRGGSRFQSVNYPDRYIRHYRGIVEVSSASDPRDDRRTTPFLNDSTWLPS